MPSGSGVPPTSTSMSGDGWRSGDFVTDCAEGCDVLAIDCIDTDADGCCGVAAGVEGRFASGRPDWAARDEAEAAAWTF